jgi:hypothetical protein
LVIGGDGTPIAEHATTRTFPIFDSQLALFRERTSVFGTPRG